MEKINGIVLFGKFYEIVEGNECKDCAFYDQCQECPTATESGCDFFSGYVRFANRIFRYSPSLTERLNNPDLLNGK